MGWLQVCLGDDEGEISWKSQQVPFNNVRAVLKSSKGCYLVPGVKYFVENRLFFF